MDTEKYRAIRDGISDQAGVLAALIADTDHNGRHRPPAPIEFTEAEADVEPDAPAKPAEVDLKQGHQGPRMTTAQANQLRLQVDDLTSQERAGIMGEVLSAGAGQLIDIHRRLNG